MTSGGTLRSVLNPSNRIRIPLLPLGKQLDHDQPRNKSAAEGLAIFGLAAIFITQIVAICVLARTFKRGHVLRGLFSVLSIICSLLLISIMVFFVWFYLGLFDSCRKQRYHNCASFVRQTGERKAQTCAKGISQELAPNRAKIRALCESSPSDQRQLRASLLLPTPLAAPSASQLPNSRQTKRNCEIRHTSVLHPSSLLVGTQRPGYFDPVDAVRASRNCMSRRRSLFNTEGPYRIDRSCATRRNDARNGSR